MAEVTPHKTDDPRAPRPHGHASVVFIVAIVALTLAQLVGSRYFSTHFSPGTTVNGQDVSGMTEDELADAVERDAASWSDHVTGDGFTMDVSAADVSLDVDAKAYAKAAMAKADGSTWCLDTLVHRRIAVTEAVTFDEDALSALVTQAVDAFNENATPPTDATSSYDEKAGAFEISRDSVGTQLDAAAVTARVAKGVRTLATGTSLTDAELAQPTVSADDEALVAGNDKANAILRDAVSLTRDGSEVTRLDAATVAPWVSVQGDGTVSVNQDAVAQWAQGALAEAVASSDEVHDYALDATSLASTLTSELEAGSSDAVEIPLTVTATRPEESEGHESRGRHIDVNLTTQYARLYDTDGTVLWRSYFVSGNTSAGRGTPTGTYSIENKRTNVTLVGADKDGDGEPDYRSDVRYWMPFLNNDYGLHDASWRSSFGGSIYSYAGSHGCVNLPSDAAAELYSLVRVGDEVYVHW